MSRLAVYVPEQNNEHVSTLMAFARGASLGGIDTEILPFSHYRPTDYAVVFGVGKKDVPISFPRAKVIANQRNAYKTTIVPPLLAPGPMARAVLISCISFKMVQDYI